MTFAEHKAQGHEASYVGCKVCWASVTFDASPTCVTCDQPITYAEQRGMERARERVEAAKPATFSEPCRRCGTYCDGDCAAR